MADFDNAEFDYDDAALDPSQFEQKNFQKNSSLRRTSVAVQVQNKPHDEEVALSESGSLMSPDDLPVHRGFTPSGASQLDASHDSLASSPSRLGQSPNQTGSPSDAHVESPRDTAAPSQGGEPGAYNPEDFRGLAVSEDVRDLFKYIGRYRPQSIELETTLKPFVPDYIPALGGIDEFIKVPRPDGKPDHLGLKVLDEPAAQQSDPAVLNLQLRQLTREVAGARLDVVGKVEAGDAQRSRRIQQWVQSITEVHKGRAPSSFVYSQPMPDVEVLMQEWPPELEGALSSMKLPNGRLDLSLESYSRLVCAVLDIPVYGDRIVESLHLLFTLFLEFKNNPFFRQHMSDGQLNHLASGESAAASGARQGTEWTAGCP